MNAPAAVDTAQLQAALAEYLAPWVQALNLRGASDGQNMCRVSTTYALLSGRAVRQKVKSGRFKP